MVRESDCAVPALELLAAGTADDGKGVAAPVEQNDGLLAALEGLSCLLDERAGEKLLLASLLKFPAHIDQFDFGQRTILDAVVHLDPGVLAKRGVLPALERWRGRAEDDDGSGKLCPHDRDIAGIVARRLLLLV